MTDEIHGIGVLPGGVRHGGPKSESRVVLKQVGRMIRATWELHDLVHPGGGRLYGSALRVSGRKKSCRPGVSADKSI